MQYTKEQKKIVESVKQNYNDTTIKGIVVNAFAGTGKTTTMVEVAKTLKQLGAKKVLYLAYNKQMQVEAQAKFKGLAEVKTIHSLAYTIFNKVINLQQFLNSKKHLYSIADKTDIQAYKNYLKDNTIIPTNKVKEIINDILQGQAKMEHDLYLKAYYCALHNYNLFNVNNIAIEKYDAIILDEAQDANDLIIGILDKLQAKLKIVVGDSHQQIYAFRGATNALIKFSKKWNIKPLYLTKSFRFGKDTEMEQLANNILQTYKKEDKKLIGAGTITQKENNTKAIISRTNNALIFKVFEADDWNNIIIIGKLEDLLKGFSISLDLRYADKDEVREHYKKNKSYLNKYKALLKINKIVDPYIFFKYAILGLDIQKKENLTDKEMIILNKQLKNFNIDEMGDIAKAIQFLDNSNTTIINNLLDIYYKSNNTLPSLIFRDLFKSVRTNIKTFKQKDIVYLTAHAAKGLEFDEVEIIGFKYSFYFIVRNIVKLAIQKIYDPFINKKDKELKFFIDIIQEIKALNYAEIQQIENEFNLAYVAVTRAKESLNIEPKSAIFVRNKAKVQEIFESLFFYIYNKTSTK